MAERREQNSSEESNSSNPSSNPSTVFSRTGAQGTPITPMSSVPESVPDESRSHERQARPSLWTPTDRPGRVGARDRHQRRCRLTRSIELSPEQLRDILVFMWEHEGYDGVKWTPEMLFSYVPRTFEAAVVGEASAKVALEESVAPNIVRHIPE